MLFGNKETIAIEFELHDKHDGRWMQGSFCIYLNNQILGHPDEVTTLSDVKQGLKYILQTQLRRYHPKLFQLQYHEILQKIICSWYNDDDDNPLIEQLMIDVIDDTFFDFFIYVVDTDTHSKIIYGKNHVYLNDSQEKIMLDEDYDYKNDPYNLIKSIIVPRGEFESVIKQAYNQLCEIDQKLIDSEINF